MFLSKSVMYLSARVDTYFRKAVHVSRESVDLAAFSPDPPDTGSRSVLTAWSEPYDLAFDRKFCRRVHGGSSNTPALAIKRRSRRYSCLSLPKTVLSASTTTLGPTKAPQRTPAQTLRLRRSDSDKPLPRSGRTQCLRNASGAFPRCCAASPRTTWRFLKGAFCGPIGKEFDGCVKDCFDLRLEVFVVCDFLLLLFRVRPCILERGQLRLDLSCKPARARMIASGFARTARSPPFGPPCLLPDKPGQSGNPLGKPVGARTAFSNAYIRDFALVWQEEGLNCIRKMASKNPDGFVAIASIFRSSMTDEEEFAALKWTRKAMHGYCSIADAESVRGPRQDPPGISQSRRHPERHGQSVLVQR